MSGVTYTIFAEPAAGAESWGAWIPELDVYVTACSRDEALDDAAVAARENLELREQLGHPLPAPVSTARTLTV